MRLRERISRVLRRPDRAPVEPRSRSARPAASSRSRTALTDARKASGALAGLAVELLKIVREMLAIPAQIWIALAELAGAGVLTAWRGAVLPLLAALLAFVQATYLLARRHVTPARAVVVVALAALIALAASQWLDYRGVSVGTDAYSSELEAVAPAPEVDRERTGEAHAWAMLPLAVGGLAVLGFAIAGRHRAALLLVVIGVAAIAIGVAIDVPQGLDEGNAAIAYEGAEARLLEGFWLQIAAGSVLIACGLMLPRYLRAASAPAAAPAGGSQGGTRRLLSRVGALGGHRPRVERKRAVTEART